MAQMTNKSHLAAKNKMLIIFFGVKMKQIKNPTIAKKRAKKNVLSLMFFPNRKPHMIRIKKPLIFEIKAKEDKKKLKKYKQERKIDTKSVQRINTISVKISDRRFFFI